MGGTSICGKAIFTLLNADQLSGNLSYESAYIDCDFWQGIGCLDPFKNNMYLAFKYLSHTISIKCQRVPEWVFFVEVV